MRAKRCEGKGRINWVGYGRRGRIREKGVGGSEIVSGSSTMPGRVLLGTSQGDEEQCELDILYSHLVTEKWENQKRISALV